MSLHSFLKIDGANGQSSLNPFEDWFAAGGFDIGAVTQVPLPTNGGGGGANDLLSGAATFLGSAVPTPSPLHYFIKIGNLKGDSTVKGYENWFSVDGYDWGVQTPSSTSAGGGAGKAQFSPLTVDVHSLAGLAPLFGDAVTGKTLPSVELVGLQGESNLKVYDVKLSSAQITSFANDPGTNGVETALAFNFAKISVTDQVQKNDGSLGTPETFTFDLKANKTAAALAPSDLLYNSAPNLSGPLVMVESANMTPTSQDLLFRPTLAATYS